MLDPLSIPAIAELAGRDQWIVWRYVPAPAKPKPSKVPCSPDKKNIDPHNPTNWLTFQEAHAASAQDGIDGIGFVFTSADPYCGLDLDCCRDPQTGVIIESARDLIDKFGTYTEVSPSGTGLKLILRGSVPPGGNKKNYDWHNDCAVPRVKSEGPQAEIAGFDNGRYFAMTGEHLEGTPRTIEARQNEINAVWRHLFPAPKSQPKGAKSPEQSTLSDEDIVHKASRARNGAKFKALYYSGDWQAQNYPSRSEADLALMTLFAFYTSNADRIIELFKTSALWREQGKGTNYLEITAATALNKQGAVKYSAPYRHRPRETRDGGAAPRAATRPRAPRAARRESPRTNVHVLAAARPQAAMPAMPKLPTDAGPDVILEALNGILRDLEVYNGPLQVIRVSRVGDAIEVLTNRGKVQFEDAGEITEYKSAKRQLAKDIGIVLPLDRTPQIKVLWNNAASLIVALIPEGEQEESPATVIVRDAAMTLWIGAGYPEGHNTDDFLQLIKKETDLPISRMDAVPGCVFPISGDQERPENNGAWIDLRVARLVTAARGRDIDYNVWKAGLVALGFKRIRTHRKSGHQRFRLVLWKGPLDVLEKPLDFIE